MPAEAAAIGRAAPARERRRRVYLVGREVGVATAFVAPALLVLVAMNVLPLLWSFGMSFFRYHADRLLTPPRFVGLSNYVYLLLNEDVWEHAQNTATLVGGSVIVQVSVGSLLAWLLYRPFAGRRLVLMLVLTPMLLSTVMVGTFFNFFYDPTFGLVSALLRPILGHPVALLATPTSAMLSLIVADAWMWSPFVMLMLLAGLQGVQPVLLEAAQIDRLTGWQQFRAVFLPALRGVLLLAVVFRLIESFNQFDLVYTITNGGPGTSTETLSTEVYDQGFVLFDTSRASALANLGAFVIVVLVQLYFHALRRQSPEYAAMRDAAGAEVARTARTEGSALSRHAQWALVLIAMPLALLLLVGVPYLLRVHRAYPRLLIVPPPPGSTAAVEGWPNLQSVTVALAAFSAIPVPDGTVPPGPALAVPDSAVLFENDGVRVWVLGADGVPVPRSVRIGRAVGGMVEILAGLEAGERVVTHGGPFLDRAWKGY
jgi:multiple sugar transport system permease protein